MVDGMNANEAAARAWELRVNLARVALSILHESADAEDAVATAISRHFSPLLPHRLSFVKKIQSRDI